MSENDVTEHYKLVREFMQKAGQSTPDNPTVPSADDRELRASLILEEALETIAALGFYVRAVPGVSRIKDMRCVELHPTDNHSMLEVIDGCCDIHVVTTGTMIAYGLPDTPFQRAVDENNLAKFGDGSYRRDDGKWMKPPNHPDVKDEFRRLLGTY